LNTGRDLFLNFTKEELRVEILRKLGMRAPPDVAAKKLVSFSQKPFLFPIPGTGQIS